MLPEQIDYTWDGFLKNEVFAMLKEIYAKTGENVNPCTRNILRFLRVNLENVKVVVLGQDPYPQLGMATGRAFEVGGLTSWQQPFRQVSLKNMIRLLHKNYHRIGRYEDILSFNQIRKEIEAKAFPILPPDQLFVSWERQGVLLLNTSFSCIPGKPGSHKHLWCDFSKQLLQYISSNAKYHWFLWGKDAAEKKVLLQQGTFHISRHPMLCSPKYEDDFLRSNCFFDTWDRIQWLGK